MTQIEWLEIYNRLVPFGVAIILNESLNRDTKQWDVSTFNSTENPDFARIDAVRDYLVATTPLSEATPALGIGFSNGGSFVSGWATMAATAGWDVRGYVAHSGGGYAGGGPALYVGAENDATAPASAMEAAATACSAVVPEGCPYLHGTEIPMDPRRFARLPAYSLNESQEVFDELVDLAYIDADGNRLIEDITDINAIMAEYVARSRFPGADIAEGQIRVVWATHRVSSQHADEEVQWMLDQL